MRRLAIFCLAISITGAAYAGHGVRNYGVSSVEECSPRNVQFGDGYTTYVEKETLDASALRSIRIDAESSPVSVRGGDRYSVTVCKAAISTDLLREIHVSLDANAIKTDGPNGRYWSVQYLITTPPNAKVDVTATNGPLALSQVDGTITARAINGPLALDRLSGEVEASTTNGPISISGGTGNIKATAANGPISVELTGNSWRGGSLDAASKNGPLTLVVPRGYNSGVVVESNGRGPVSCRAEGCERARVWNEDDGRYMEPRRIELGHGAESVHLTTVNGPITIKESQD